MEANRKMLNVALDKWWAIQRATLPRCIFTTRTSKYTSEKSLDGEGGWRHDTITLLALVLTIR